jgi:membrane protein YqaA with SNARE-associated domain
MKIKKIDIIFLLILILISTLAIDFLLNESHRHIIENIAKYPAFQDIFSGIIITFFVTLIGNLSPIPTPYTFVICYSSIPFYQSNILVPLLIAFIASLGSLFGELGGYLVGRGSSRLISKENQENLQGLQNFLLNHPKVAPLFIYLFGLTPLNDDLLMVPLGLIKYDFKKTILYCWLGKLSLMIIFAYNTLNICQLLGGESWILTFISLYLMVIFVYLILKVDIILKLRHIFEKLKKPNKK